MNSNNKIHENDIINNDSNNNSLTNLQVKDILINEYDISNITDDLNFTLYEEWDSEVIVFSFKNLDIWAIKFSFIDDYISLDKVSNINYNTKINEQWIDLWLFTFMNEYLSTEEVWKLKIHWLLEYMYKYFIWYIKTEFKDIKLIKSEINPSFLESRLFLAEKLKKSNISTDYKINYDNMELLTYI